MVNHLHYNLEIPQIGIHKITTLLYFFLTKVQAAESIETDDEDMDIGSNTQ